ncbi:MAG: tRNA (guanine(37)-N(1))-methyltransferase [Thermales bacterium]|nr:tRNA (guanine(37)-N(1))-methyltransferase [Thermales bacterium]
MLFRNFTLHPGFFESFAQTSLIARGIKKNIIQIENVNWRDEFGIGGYKQVDDKPYGGGNGMVLMVDPIYRALQNMMRFLTFLIHLPKKPFTKKRLQIIRGFLKHGKRGLSSNQK